MASSSSSSSSNTVPSRVAIRTARGTPVRSLSWCDVPSDLYGLILRRLPSNKDRVRLGVVCRHWRVCAWQHLPRCKIHLPMRMTRTARGAHVVHVRGVSRLQEQCGVDGLVDSPAFAVGGLYWAIRIRYYPPLAGIDGDDPADGHVGAFVVLLTEGAVASAYVGLRLLDQTTGLMETVIWDEHRTRFDAAATADCSWWTRARGTGMLAARSELKTGSRFVRGDCLKIECVLDDVCRDRDRDHRMLKK